MAKTRSKIMDSSDYSQHYTWMAINNEKCIVFHFPNDEKAAKMKSIKDNLAQSILDTIMLNTRASNQKKVFCGAHFVSETSPNG